MSELLYNVRRLEGFNRILDMNLTEEQRWKTRERVAFCEGFIKGHESQPQQAYHPKLIAMFKQMVTSNTYKALKGDPTAELIDGIIPYVGCSPEELREHLTTTLPDGYTFADWSRTGIHIDHKIPVTYNQPTIDEVAARLHWTNIQFMEARSNIKKGNRLY